jgi:broad specificity phosphatase PhoE
MARLILIRHGQSEGNRDRVFTLTPAVPLTDHGRVQARAAGRWIADRYAPRKIVASPFVRAQQTAEELAQVLDVPIEIEHDLRERSYGDLAGQPYSILQARTDFDPTTYWLWRPPGGETLIEVAQRAGAVLDRLVEAAPEDDMIVVSHGATMMSLWWHVTGAWREGRVARNAGIVVAEHRAGRWQSAAMAEAATTDTE